VKYELGFYIPEDDILHSHRRENLKSYKILYAGWNPCSDKSPCRFPQARFYKVADKRTRDALGQSERSILALAWAVIAQTWFARRRQICAES
jgi:hypothetical protein